MIDVSNLTLEQLYALRVEVNNHIEKYEKAAKASIAVGIPYPNFELKKGRAMRSWKDEAAVEAALRAEGFKSADIFNIKMKGIPDITKMAKAHSVGLEKTISGLIETTTAKSTLVYTGEPVNE